MELVLGAEGPQLRLAPGSHGHLSAVLSARGLSAATTFADVPGPNSLAAVLRKAANEWRGPWLSDLMWSSPDGHLSMRLHHNGVNAVLVAVVLRDIYPDGTEWTGTAEVRIELPNLDACADAAQEMVEASQ